MNNYAIRIFRGRKSFLAGDTGLCSFPAYGIITINHQSIYGAGKPDNRESVCRCSPPLPCDGATAPDWKQTGACGRPYKCHWPKGREGAQDAMKSSRKTCQIVKRCFFLRRGERKTHSAFSAVCAGKVFFMYAGRAREKQAATILFHAGGQL